MAAARAKIPFFKTELARGRQGARHRRPGRLRLFRQDGARDRRRWRNEPVRTAARADGSARAERDLTLRLLGRSRRCASSDDGDDLRRGGRPLFPRRAADRRLKRSRLSSWASSFSPRCRWSRGSSATSRCARSRDAQGPRALRAARLRAGAARSCGLGLHRPISCSTAGASLRGQARSTSYLDMPVAPFDLCLRRARLGRGAGRARAARFASCAAAATRTRPARPGPNDMLTALTGFVLHARRVLHRRAARHRAVDGRLFRLRLHPSRRASPPRPRWRGSRSSG